MLVNLLFKEYPSIRFYILSKKEIFPISLLLKEKQKH